jgi:hypothetical protein
MAELRLDGQDHEHRVKVRNLASRGLMAEGNVSVTRGSVVWLNLRNAGWVEGIVAWVQDNRFGVAFQTEIDPKAVRAAPPPASDAESLIVRRPGTPARYREPSARKIL